ncbi:hypothetical protein ACP70R_046623 [Stipagrostis hirtigluma subsp. patula]
MPSAAETAAELEKAAKAKADAEAAAKAKAAMEEAARAEQAHQCAADQAAFATMQEAAAVAALHAQAVAVQNIKAFIPFVLDITTSNYTKWKTLFLNTLSKYELTDHVLEDVPAEENITPHVLDARFRNFAQGDLSITDYCRRMKTMADELGDLGEPVLDRTLVLNVIRGLNERYEHIGTHIQRSRPLPSFIEARADLQLAEITCANHFSLR